jgi:hypothetical protein
MWTSLVRDTRGLDDAEGQGLWFVVRRDACEWGELVDMREFAPLPCC